MVIWCRFFPSPLLLTSAGNYLTMDSWSQHLPNCKVDRNLCTWSAKVVLLHDRLQAGAPEKQTYQQEAGLMTWKETYLITYSLHPLKPSGFRLSREWQEKNLIIGYQDGTFVLS